jgi:hypothetical protein
MNPKILLIANAMIRKARNPNVSNPLELPFCSKREPAFQALNRQFDAGAGSNKQMKMIGHQDKRMEEITLRSVPIKSFKE